MMDDPTLKRFLRKARLQGDCWIWESNLNNMGYGTFWFQGRAVLAHRLSYEHFVGPIPQGLELDHLCQTPACINPAHLEAIIHVENLHRGRGNQHVGTTHCKNGHEFTPDNIYIDPAKPTVRQCRECRREYMRRWKEKHVKR